MPFDWAQYRAELSTDSPDPSWGDAADLSRLSIDGFLADLNPVRRDQSLGILRFAGPGVSGHSAHIDDVADGMKNFQRLVLATGMSLTGHKSLRGQVPADILSRTRLQLNGSAIPGSLVLEMAPAMLPSQEIMPSGQASFLDDAENQLVDTAMARSIELLNLSKSVGPDADASEFLSLLTESGPRVATTLRDFAKSLASAQFDAEIAWMQPRQRRLVSRMTVTEFNHLGDLVASRELAAEPIRLTGVLRTVSDLSPFKIEVSDGEIETVDVRRILPDDIKSFLVGMSVEMSVDVTEETMPGGDVKTKYAATSIRSLG